MALFFRTEIPPYGATVADRSMGGVERDDALTCLHDRLHAHRLYPSMSYFDKQTRLHVANKITVEAIPGETGVSYHWRIETPGTPPRKCKAPANTPNEIDAAARQIADTVYQLPVEQLTS